MQRKQSAALVLLTLVVVELLLITVLSMPNGVNRKELTRAWINWHYTPSSQNEKTLADERAAASRYGALVDVTLLAACIVNAWAIFMMWKRWRGARPADRALRSCIDHRGRGD